MTNALFHAHSGLRYLVLLAALAAVAYLVFAVATGRTAGKADRTLVSIFTGLLDLQILLGVVLMVTGIYYPALIGHLFMMVLAAVAAHGGAVAGKRAADARRALQFRLIGVVLALLLIVGGIGAIGRSVFGSGAPSVVG